MKPISKYLLLRNESTAIVKYTLPGNINCSVVLYRDEAYDQFRLSSHSIPSSVLKTGLIADALELANS